MVRARNYQIRQVQTPSSILHFKTACSLLDEEIILATHQPAATGCFADDRVIQTANGEEASAHSIRVNDLVLMAEGFPRTVEKV